MGPIENIRRNVFRVTQTEFARIAGGVTQATVSRWENGQAEPSRAEMDGIRAEATSRGLDWDDHWFFSAPDPSAQHAEPAA